MTHADLVKRAERWLRGTKHCGVVLSERRCGGAREVPDAIGWRASFWSILVECKATRSDFLKDRKKVFRMDPDSGMGQTRWFMVAPGVVKDLAELPDGWGLLEVRGRIKALREATQVGYNFQAARRELALLYSAMRRVQLGVEPTFGIVLSDARRLSDAEREAVRAARALITKGSP